MAGKDILAIGPIQIAQSESLFSGAPVFYQDGRLRVTERTPVERAFDLFSPYERSDSATVDGFFSGSDSFSGIVGFQSPFDAERSVVALLASDPEALPTLVNGLNDTRINAQVQGDLSVVDGEGMASFAVGDGYWVGSLPRSEEHTSELQSLMRISYAVFCLKKKTNRRNNTRQNINTTT